MSSIDINRERAQNIRLLDRAIRTKTRRRLRHASIGIVGSRFTGKKTLARRFGAMDQGPFEDEVQSRYYYRAYVDLDARHTDGTGDVFLKFLVFPMPRDLPAEEAPRFHREFRDFSVMIFLCSVTDRATLETMIDRMQDLREGFYRDRLPYFILVGNKVDLNRVIYPNHFTFTYGLFAAQYLVGANYEECSAKQNTNVDIILEEILIHIIDEQP